MLYLYVLMQGSPPTADLLEQVASAYSQMRGEVTVLGVHQISRQLPRDPDMYVVTCAFEACRKAGLQVGANSDVAYSLDTFAGETIGVCQIRT